MASGSRLQASRFEYKFVIDEPLAKNVCDFARTRLEPDDYAKSSSDRSYPVHSLYLDSPNRVLYQQTADGLKNRFKLRIRFYDGDPQGPVFLEVKRRISGVIAKQRAVLDRPTVRSMLEGLWPDPSQLLDDGRKDRSAAALQTFREGCESVGAGPSIYVCYRREAYVSPDSNHIRVTFDRHLMGSPFDWETSFVPPGEGLHPKVGNGDRIILELKFTDRFPAWMEELVQTFNLHRRSVPKYNLCIERMGLRP
jgi:hypothetical protein